MMPIDNDYLYIQGISYKVAYQGITVKGGKHYHKYQVTASTKLDRQGFSELIPTRYTTEQTQRAIEISILNKHKRLAGKRTMLNT